MLDAQLTQIRESQDWPRAVAGPNPDQFEPYGPPSESGPTDIDIQAEEFVAEIRADENREVVEQIQAEEELPDIVTGKPRL